MEQIPKEVIEMTEDFFSYLSEEEMKKVNYIFFLEQKPLQFGIVEGLKLIKDPEVARKCTWLYLIIYRSYKYYNVQLPEISGETIGKTFIAFSKSFDEKKGTSVSPREMSDEMKVLTQQYNMTHYVFMCLYGTDGNAVKYKYEKDGFNAVFLLISIILILNNETKKLIGDEVN